MKYLSVYQTELHAIHKATVFCISKNITNKDIKFYSDSRSSLEALRKKFITSSQLKQNIDKLNQLASGNRVTLRWVKAHIGHPGNEKADELAKNGANKEGNFITANNIPLVEANFIRAMVRDKIVDHWNTLWKALSTSEVKRNTSYLK